MKTVSIVIRGTWDTDDRITAKSVSEQTVAVQKATQALLDALVTPGADLLKALSAAGVKVGEASVTVANRVTPGSHAADEARSEDWTPPLRKAEPPAVSETAPVNRGTMPRGTTVSTEGASAGAA